MCRGRLAVHQSPPSQILKLHGLWVDVVQIQSTPLCVCAGGAQLDVLVHASVHFRAHCGVPHCYAMS